MNLSLDSLAEYARRFHGCFRRSDQARWMEVYVRGLLEFDERKNPESLARGLAEPDHSANLAQSLQNFVNQSPWNESTLWQRLRTVQRERLGDEPVAAVIEEVGFLKQGTHSVGVQRQYWHENGKKRNCQLAVVLYAVTRRRAFPLGLRLYLPRAWTSDVVRLDAAGVPEEARAAASKGQIALGLLHAAWSSGYRFDMVLGRGLSGSSVELYEELARREQPCLFDVAGEHQVISWETAAMLPVRELRLTPLAATSELSWTNVALPDASGPRRPWQVIAAPAEKRFCLGRLGHDFDEGHWQRARRCREHASDCQEHLRRLGLDHFEGRSWRGFHHHVCLVALAHACATRDA